MNVPLGDAPVLGEIVERSVSVSSSVRPILAVAGVAFPTPRPTHSYSAVLASCAETDPARSTRGAHTAGYTAHVQPMGTASPVAALAEGADAATVSSRSATQQQWDPKDLEGLQRGYYATLPPSLCSSSSSPCSSAPGGVLLCGEAYVELLLRFLRSTVRTHRECAMRALHDRLPHDAQLRVRCVAGVGCAQLLHFVITGLHAGHAVPCRLAAECLDWLLFDAPRETAETIGEIAVPPPDPMEDAVPNEDSAGERVCGAGSHETEATYAALSASLRIPAERAVALERLGLHTALFDASPLLAPPLLARVMLGGGGATLAHVAKRIALDPRYVQGITARLGAVLTGTISLAEVMAEVLLLRRLLHIRHSAVALLPQLHGTLVLLLQYVCAAELHSAMDVLAATAVFLAVRSSIRHGRPAVFQDATDAVLSPQATARGVGIAAEMWLLLHQSDMPSEEGGSPWETLAAELARGAIVFLQSEQWERDDPAVLLPALAAMHYLATYVVTSDGAAVSVLLGPHHETRRRVQELLAKRVLTAEGLRRAFLRLRPPNHDKSNASQHVHHGAEGVDASSHSPSSSYAAASLSVDVPIDAALREACWASLTHARIRLAAAVDSAFPNSSDAFLGYATALAARFEERYTAALAVDAAALPPDELCAMVEVVRLLHHTDASDPGRMRCEREAFTAAVFVLHGMATTKHGLDAAVVLLALSLGLPKREETKRAPNDGTGEEPLRALTLSLEQALAQSQWLWVLFPLHDDALPDKSVWATWVRRVLGAHQRLKHLLQWDLILCDALRWAVTQMDPSAPNEELLALLEELCGGVLPALCGSGSKLSARACNALRALTASAPPHAEEGMHERLITAMALTATACEPTAAVELARLLTHTNPCAAMTMNSPPVASTGATKRMGLDSSACVAAVLRRWAETGRLGDAVGAVEWDLETLVSLLQAAAGEVWGRGAAAEASSGITAARLLADGVVRAFLHSRRNGVTPFERQVLRGTVEELGWCPAALLEVV